MIYIADIMQVHDALFGPISLLAAPRYITTGKKDCQTAWRQSLL
jgi:hypothetical protein